MMEVQNMTRDQIILVMKALYHQLEMEIHKDSYQDEFVFKNMSRLEDLANGGGLELMFELSDTYAEEHAKEMTRHFFNGNRQRYEAA